MEKLWEYKKIGEVCTVERGGSPRPIDKFITNDKNGINWIKIGDASDSMYITSTAQKIILEGMKKSRYVKPGDFLLSNSMSFGRPYILKIDGCIHDGWLVLRDETEVFDKRFLYYYLSSTGTYEKFKSMAVGGVVNNLNSEMVRNIHVPIPSKNEQSEIANILDKVRSILDNRENELKSLDNLIKARFVEMFGLPVSNTKKWFTEKMSDVAPSINYTGKFNDKIWLLNLDMIEAQTGEIIDYLFVNEDEVGSSTCSFDTSNVLYSKLRPYLNKVVIPNRCGYATSELVPLQPAKGKLNREYLAFMLRSDEFVNMINEKVIGAKMPRVSMSDLIKFNVPIPPIELQNQFATFVHQVDKSKVVVQKYYKI